MAIAFDNAASFTFTPGTYSTTYTMGSLSGGFLVINASFNVTAISYGGFAMANYVHYQPAIPANGPQINVFYLINPPTGSNTLALTAGATSGTIGIASYTGVNYSGPEGYVTATANDGTNNTQEVTYATAVTTVANNSWTIMFTRGGNNFPKLFVAGSTVRTSGSFIFGDNTHGIYDSNGAISPAGSSTLTAHWESGSGFISNVIISIPPSSFAPQLMII
jgi:hypothetical protein